MKTPTVLQMEAVECGAAALGIVLGYYGRFVPLEELRAVCNVTRDGSNAANIVTAAEHYGLEAAGYKYEIDSLQQQHFPVVVFWNFSHFLVVEGFGRNKVYLNDPASGPRTVRPQEFSQDYMGIVLTFRPGPDFKKGGERQSALKGLRKRLAPVQGAVSYAVLAGLLLTVMAVIVPAFTQIFINKYLVQGMTGWISPLLTGMVVMACVMSIVLWMQQQDLLRIQTKLSVSLSAQMFWHIVRLPMQFFTQRQAGDITTRVSLNVDLASLLSGSLATNVIGLFTIVVFLGAMLRYDVLLTAVAVALGTVNLVALHYVSRRRMDQNKQLLQQQARLTGAAMSGLRTIDNIKAAGEEADFFARWAGYQAKVINAEQDLGVSTQVLSVVPPFLAALNATAILVVGGFRVMDGNLSLGALIAFQVLVVSFMSPISGLVMLGTQVQQVQGDLSRIDDVLENPLEETFLHPPPPISPDTPPRLTGHINIQNITFGYDPDAAPLIDSFSLTFTPGARVALVGASGSGKSTLASIITGINEPWSGNVLFDGRPRGDIPRAVLAASIGVADQDFTLFTGTIEENLTLWDLSIPRRDVVEAADDAMIREDIESRPGGFTSDIGENGANFSGGQRQRLAVARALFRNPSVVILDEATSALDPPTESQVDNNIRRRGCTCLIIAHRLSTIRDCDEIIVLQEGKVVQRGTHDEMLEKGGPYALLISSGDAIEAGAAP